MYNAFDKIKNYTFANARLTRNRGYISVSTKWPSKIILLETRDQGCHIRSSIPIKFNFAREIPRVELQKCVKPLALNSKSSKASLPEKLSTGRTRNKFHVMTCATKGSTRSLAMGKKCRLKLRAPEAFNMHIRMHIFFLLLLTFHINDSENRKSRGISKIYRSRRIIIIQQ